jgi:hypothetical protein
LETPYGINDIQVTAADVILGQIFFVRAWIWCHCEECLGAGGHFEVVVIVYNTFIPLTSPHHKQEVLKKEYSEVTIEKFYKGQNFISFITTREQIVILWKKGIVSIL